MSSGTAYSARIVQATRNSDHGIGLALYSAAELVLGNAADLDARNRMLHQGFVMHRSGQGLAEKAHALADGGGAGHRRPAYASCEAFGKAVLATGSGLAMRAIDAVLNSEYIIYEAAEFKFGIALVERANYHEFDERLAEIKVGLGLAVLLVTDVERATSRSVLVGRQMERLEYLPYRRLPEGILDVPDMVRRKKQLLPLILSLPG